MSALRESEPEKRRLSFVDTRLYDVSYVSQSSYGIFSMHNLLE